MEYVQETMFTIRVPCPIRGNNFKVSKKGAT